MRKEDKLYTVYRLENVVTKKNYIGMTSRNPKRRWRSGYNGKMGDAINNYPFDLCWKKHIEFQTSNKEQALELESELMKWYDSIENGYNTSSYGGTSYKRTEETKRKMAEAKSGRILTEEHRKKISEAMTGEKHPNFGKHPTEEIRKKMSENRPSKSVLQFSKSGELIAEYPSGKEAQKQTGLPTSNICSCCKGRQKSCGGYIWRYK